MQLRLFGPKPFDLLAKIAQEARDKVTVRYHFNGAPIT